jgi:hypothetical protein
VARKTHGVIYICGDQEGCRRIEKAGKRIGLYSTDECFRIEPLDTIQAETVAAFETARTPAERTAA